MFSWFRLLYDDIFLSLVLSRTLSFHSNQLQFTYHFGGQRSAEKLQKSRRHRHLKLLHAHTHLDKKASAWLDCSMAGGWGPRRVSPREELATPAGGFQLFSSRFLVRFSSFFPPCVSTSLYFFCLEARVRKNQFPGPGGIISPNSVFSPLCRLHQVHLPLMYVTTPCCHIHNLSLFLLYLLCYT